MPDLPNLPEGVLVLEYGDLTAPGNWHGFNRKDQFVQVTALPSIVAAELERVRSELGMLAMMLRENQRHEEGDRNHYDEKGERTHPRRLMHDGKAAAYRHAEANLTPIIAALDPTKKGDTSGDDVPQ